MLSFLGFALTSSNPVRPIQVDMIYNCGEKLFLTPVNIRDPRFEHAQSSDAFAKREPIIPVCFMVSNGRKQEDYEYLAKNLAKAAELKETDRVAFWISDCELALVKGFQSISPFHQPGSHHIRCKLHLQSNVEGQISKTVKGKRLRDSILEDIFGSELQLARCGRICERGTHTLWILMNSYEWVLMNFNFSFRIGWFC